MHPAMVGGRTVLRVGGGVDDVVCVSIVIVLCRKRAFKGSVWTGAVAQLAECSPGFNLQDCRNLVGSACPLPQDLGDRRKRV